MPCYDAYPYGGSNCDKDIYPVDKRPEYILSNSLAQRDAMLCAVFRRLQETGDLSDVIESLDYIQAGISKDYIYEWWEKHLNRDKNNI